MLVILIRIHDNWLRSLTAFSGHRKPSCEPAAGKQHPYNRQSYHNQPWKNRPHEISQRIRDRASGITAKTAIEKSH